MNKSRVILGSAIFKLKYFKDKLISDYQKSLFGQNKNSRIHPSFRLGFDNFVQIDPEFEIDIAENVAINKNNFLIFRKKGSLSIGKNTYITNSTISCRGKIKIGKNCLIGEGAKMFDHNHSYTRNPFSVLADEFNIGEIIIGDNLWTGSNVTILKNVKIGDNVIIGSGCLIHKDIPANSIVKNRTEVIIDKF
ncbi:MAG: acyltransferase [Bergeyella sp.]|nr:acyltransferase [Bergeyella sp.]